jgi:adenylate cyclase class 2
MAFEIEVKVRLDGVDPVKKRLSALGNYCRSYDKSDSYWFPVQPSTCGMSFPPSGVRIRRENSLDANGTAHKSVLVTYKTKEISDGIEINDEREFTVSAEDAGPLFEEFLGRMGLYSDIRKEKKGWAWTISSQTSGQPPILAELSLVAGLGWFLELEILADDNCRQTVEENRKRLLALLEKLEIPAEWIEAKPYTVMLREKEAV